MMSRNGGGLCPGGMFLLLVIFFFASSSIASRSGGGVVAFSPIPIGCSSSSKGRTKPSSTTTKTTTTTTTTTTTPLSLSALLLHPQHQRTRSTPKNTDWFPSLLQRHRLPIRPATSCSSGSVVVDGRLSLASTAGGNPDGTVDDLELPKTEKVASSLSSSAFATSATAATASTIGESTPNRNGNESAQGVDGADDNNERGLAGVGLYRPFAEYAWQRLLSFDNKHDPSNDADASSGDGRSSASSSSLSSSSSSWNVLDLETDELSSNVASAPGGGKVRITIQAATRRKTGGGVIEYARYALLETIGVAPPPSSLPSTPVPVQTAGVQVLNMVIFPTASSGLPVFGADFVALPGNKHLLLLDAQPVSDKKETAAAANISSLEPENNEWQEWYSRHAIATQFPWNSDLPEQILPYVSQHALWTRLGGPNISSSNNTSNDATTTVVAAPVDPISHIQGPLMSAFQDHLETYLQMIAREERKLHQQQQPATAASFQSRLAEYVQYRLDNDPARPMLKRLYGEEWTEKVLHTVLFPPLWQK